MSSFNEQTLRQDIINVWGEYGAHVDVYDELLRRFSKNTDETDRMISDILDSVSLAMREAGLGHHVDDVLATVEDYIGNHYDD